MENAIAREVVDAAMEVHRFAGPGLLETAYRMMLAHELASRGLKAAAEVPVSINYKDLCVNAAYRVDVLVNDKVIVELKAVETLNASHRAQLLSYLRLSGLRLGLLINFNVPLLKNGIVRMVNKL